MEASNLSKTAPRVRRACSHSRDIRTSPQRHRTHSDSEPHRTASQRQRAHSHSENSLSVQQLHRTHSLSEHSLSARQFHCHLAHSFSAASPVLILQLHRALAQSQPRLHSHLLYGQLAARSLPSPALERSVQHCPRHDFFLDFRFRAWSPMAAGPCRLAPGAIGFYCFCFEAWSPMVAG